MLSPYLCLFHGKDVAGFRRHCRQVISPIVIVVTVPWSICLSRSCILLKRQKLSTQFLFAEDSPMPLSDCIKIWLTSVNPILPQIFP